MPAGVTFPPPAPRVYRRKRRARVFETVAAVGCIVLGVASIAAAGLFPAPPAQWVCAVVGTLMVAVGIAGLTGRNDRLVLDGERLTLHWFPRRRRTVHRDEIRGRRVRLTDPPSLVLELRSGEKPIVTSTYWETDPALDAWFSSVPDLDAEDRARIEERIAADPALGITDTDRVRALDGARRIARALHFATIACTGWGMAYPSPYWLVVVLLLLLPLVTCVLAFARRGLYTLEPRRTDPRPGLIGPLLLPGIVLVLRGFFDVAWLDYVPLLVAALIVGPLLGAFVARFEVAAQHPRTTRIMLMVGFTFYAAGALALGNWVLDRGEVETFTAEVVREHESRGSETSWHLHLGPWGPIVDADQYRVSEELHDLEVGAEVCVDLHPGSLGARWYWIRACE